MASHLTSLWNRGLGQLVAYPPPPPLAPCPGRGRRGFYWLVHGEKVVLILKGISEGKPNMTENQPKISN